MKFEQQLECLALPKFRGYYLNYNALKKAVEVFTGQERDQSTVQEVTHWTSSFLRLGPNPEVPPEAKLREILEKELERVSKFAEMEANAIHTNLSKLAADAKAAGRSMNADVARKESLCNSLDALGDQTADLKSFTLLNFTGFRKILKKYDKWSKSSVLPWFMMVVVKSPLMTIDFEGFIQSLNSCAVTIGPRHALERTRSKPDVPIVGHLSYLVDPQDAMRVRVELAKRLVLTADSIHLRGPSTGYTKVSSLAQRTSVVYFDTPDLGAYSARVVGVPSSEEAEDGTTKAPSDYVCVRFGKSDAAKVVAEAKGDTGSIEVELPKSAVTQLFRGAAPILKDAANSGVLARIAQSVRETQLCPVVLVTSSYAAFDEQSTGLKVVLEDEVKFSNIPQGASWDNVPSSGSVHFPYAILTISPAPGTTAIAPRWLSHLDKIATLIQVSGFQLGIHAEAHFRARGSGLPLPHWYRSVISEEDDAEHGSEQGAKADKAAAALKPMSPQRTPSEAGVAAARLLHEFGTAPEVEADRASRRQLSAGPSVLDFPAATESSGGGLSQPLLTASVSEVENLQKKEFWEQQKEKPVRSAIVAVQPKTLFSNERTFLDWIHFGVMYAAMGLAVGQATGRPGGIVLGRCLVGFAIAIVAWALYQFNRRADGLDKKVIIDYADHLGPPLFMGGLLVTLVFSTLHASKLI